MDNWLFDNFLRRNSENGELVNHQMNHTRGSVDEINAKDIKGAISAANILDYYADSTGKSDCSSAFVQAVVDQSDTIFIPKGTYYINKNISIPENIKIVFDRNARLKPDNSVTIRIDGSWQAGSDDWIFDLSLGGKIVGDFKLNHIYPEWVGAKGNGLIDDSDSFASAMELCDSRRGLVLGAKTYRIKNQIVNNARSIHGSAMYVDSSNSGTLLLWDPTDKSTDLLSCIKISSQAGNGTLIENIHIKGVVGYNSRDLGLYIDKSLYEQDKYEMFSNGTSAIEADSSATPIFRNVRTSDVKVGLLLNSNNGHITSHDCNWSGLIGVYCKKNTEDYFFQGGSVSGAFSGVMLGTTLVSGHNGGISLRMNRVHMGFSPYGFYQVIDSADYSSLSRVSGLSVILESVRFERIGEAAIKLLPKAYSTNIKISGFGLSWSPIDYPTDDPSVKGGWICPLPDEILERNGKQKYAAYLGIMDGNVEILPNDYGGLFKSTAPGAIGSAYIDTLSGNPNLTGLGIDELIIRRKMPSTSVTLVTPQNIEAILRTKHLNPLASGNLMKNPEDINSWKLLGTGTGTLSILSDTSLLPTPFSPEMKKYLGNDIKVIKYTPDGSNLQTVALYPPSSPLILDEGRDVCFELFILSPSASARCRIAFTGNNYLYDEINNFPESEWTRISGRGKGAIDIRQLEIGTLSKTDPTYIAGVMVSYDELSPYSPYTHPYTNQVLEADSFILKNINGNRYKLTVDDGGSLSLIKI